MNAPRKVSVANLTRKILCQKHNTDLSDLDKVGGDARRAFAQAALGSNLGLPTVSGYHQAILDGPKFERWCLKTLISIEVGGECPIGPDASIPGDVNEDAVRIAFGLEAFPPGAGLYAIGTRDEEFSCKPHLRICAIREGGRIVGGVFIMLNFRFAIMLEPMNARHVHVGRKDGGVLIGRSEVFYRPLKQAVRMGGADWIFNFHWPGAKAGAQFAAMLAEQEQRILGTGIRDRA